ncbi:MAG: hypothetical protein EOP11_03525 [Proteobacteria bacterium]|nr:MAG: hypothetical protein EOP11_03525 [Pseudomonadota bacterium]
MADGSTLKPWRARKGDQTRVMYPEKIASPLRFLLLVPVYRELDNGNLGRFVSNLAAAGATSAEVSVLFLVNNAKESSIRKDAAFEENLRTINWINEQSATTARFEVLDLASAGFEKNMGRIRQAGLAEWAARHPAELPQTVVVHLDADVRIPGDFFPRLKEAYGHYPELGAVFFQRDYDLRGVPGTALLFTHHRYRLRKALFDFTNRRTGLPDGLATYQLSARFLAHEVAGGFPPLAKDEDSAFTLRLLSSAWWVQLAELSMTTEDRTRAEGFNSARRAKDLRGLFREAGFLARLVSWLRAGRNKDYLAIKRARPPRGKDFFLAYGLFVPLSARLNEEVRRGAMPFVKAADAFRQRVENILGTPVLFGRTSLAEKAPAELDAMATVPGTGGSVLPPIAHPLSATLLMPTLTPASDLLGILHGHLGELERITLAARLESAHAAHEAEIDARVFALRARLSGEDPGAIGDPFMAWAEGAHDGLKAIFKKVQIGRLPLASAEEELTALFPDWLSKGPSFAKEALVMREINRLVAKAYLAENPGPLERMLESLRAP